MLEVGEWADEKSFVVAPENDAKAKAVAADAEANVAPLVEVEPVVAEVEANVEATAVVADS